MRRIIDMPYMNSHSFQYIRLMIIFCAGVLLASSIGASRAQQSASPSSIPAGRRAETVAIITVEGAIDAITKHSIERRLNEVNARGIDAVVLEIDTPGGDLVATLEILYLLRTIAPANTIAWIRPKAFSAGTIIALATREIVVDPNGVFGDAAPIQGMPVIGLRQMAPAERAKVEAPLLSELVHEARRHGWDEKLVQAFVAVDVELWLIENIKTGERLFIDAKDHLVIFGEEPERSRLDRLPPAPGRDPNTGFLPGAKMETDAEPPPTLEERAQDIDSVQSIASLRPNPSEMISSEWKVLGQIVSKDELLVLRADEAEAYGLSSGTAANDADITSFFGAKTVIRLDESWSEAMVRFLTWWPVRGVLIVVMLVGFFLEMAAPGPGVFGAIAVAALGVLLAAPLMVGLAQWWTAGMVVGGLLLVAAELFVIPGVGFIGLLGGACLFAGLVGTFVSPDPLGETTRSDILLGLSVTGAGFFGAGVLIWLLLNTLPNLPISKRIILGAQVGGRGSDSVPPTPIKSEHLKAIAIGDTGHAASDLRTSGRVDIHGRIVDARSVGGYITRGAPVIVTAIDAFGIEVEGKES